MKAWRYTFPSVDERGPVGVVGYSSDDLASPDEPLEGSVRAALDEMGYPQPNVLPEPVVASTAKITVDGETVDINDEIMADAYRHMHSKVAEHIDRRFEEMTIGDDQTTPM